MELFSINDRISNSYGSDNFIKTESFSSDPEEKKSDFEVFSKLVDKTIENRFENDSEESTSTTTISNETQPTKYSVKINLPDKKVPEKGSFEKVVNFWLKKGCKMAGAIALATICKFESNFKPDAVEKSEKSGKGYGISKNNTANQKGYGVGLYAWTGGEHKEKVLRAGGYSPLHTKIEDLNFDQQLDLAYDAFSELKPDTFNLIKNTTNIKDALNIAYAYLSAGSRNSNKVPSDAYCETLARKYQATHAKLGYKKAAKTNSYEQRLKYAVEKYNELI